MKGTYTAILKCRKPARIKFGKLGSVGLEAGYYLYTGSALGKGAVSLEGRLTRHKRSWKRKRWHVDHLTSCPEFRFSGAIYLVSNKRLECRINASIQHNLDAQPVLQHLGASDCKCNAHVLRLVSHVSEAKLRGRLEKVYLTFGNPQSC